MMRRTKQERLEAKGWKFGTAQEFLGLSDEETAYVELRLRLADSLRRRPAVGIGLAGFLVRGPVALPIGILAAAILLSPVQIDWHTVGALAIDVLKVSERLGFELGCRRIEPSKALGHVDVSTFTFQEHRAQIRLGVPMPLFCGFSIPTTCLGRILRPGPIASGVK